MRPGGPGIKWNVSELDLLKSFSGLTLGLLGAFGIALYTRVNAKSRKAGARAVWKRGWALAAPAMSAMGAGWCLLCLSGPTFRLPLLQALGGALALGALAIYVTSARWVGRWKRPAKYSLSLRKSGIYAYVRHPQALSLCLLVVALELLSGSVPFLVTMPLWLGFWIGYTHLEERYELLPAFGDDYARYMRETPRLVPRVPRRAVCPGDPREPSREGSDAGR
jgi:protein-S-isoprenylcysteine O-methyltransferase Ste14